MSVLAMPVTQSCRRCKGSGRELDDVATGETMRGFRKAKSASQKNVAKTMGVTAPYVCGLEKGDRHWSDDLIQAYKRAVELNKR